MSYKQSLLPSNYWRDWMPRAEKRWVDHSTRIRHLQDGGLYPSVYPEIIVAFTAPAGATENTTDARTGMGAQVPFHEIGEFQCPAGNAGRDANGIPQLPAPNSDPRAENNTWGKLHADAQVVAALGRQAVMGKDEWKTHLDDQFAIGLAMLRDCEKSVRGALPDALDATAPHTPWGVWLAFMAFSAGAGGASSAVKLFAEQLAKVDEKLRPSAHVHLAARAILDGTWHRTGSAGRHSNPAHRLVRTWQKFQFAAEIGKKFGNSKAVEFFELRLGTQFSEHEDILVREEMLLDKPTGVTLVSLY